MLMKQQTRDKTTGMTPLLREPASSILAYHPAMETAYAPTHIHVYGQLKHGVDPAYYFVFGLQTPQTTPGLKEYLERGPLGKTVWLERTIRIPRIFFTQKNFPRQENFIRYNVFTGFECWLGEHLPGHVGYRKLREGITGCRDGYETGFVNPKLKPFKGVGGLANYLEIISSGLLLRKNRNAKIQTTGNETAERKAQIEKAWMDLKTPYAAREWMKNLARRVKRSAQECLQEKNTENVD